MNHYARLHLGKGSVLEALSMQCPQETAAKDKEKKKNTNPIRTHNTIFIKMVPEHAITIQC